MRLEAKSISKKYSRQSAESNFFYAVKETDISLIEGGITVVMGRSGSGKTTLLNMLSGLLTPSSGNVTVDGTDIYALGDPARSELINEKFGIIPQGQSGIDSLTLYENILLPAGIYGRPDDDTERFARELMDITEISDLRDCRPAQLSGGELRRMAIARALINRPGVIFADEPTGDLDDENTKAVLELFRKMADGGVPVFIVTHDDTVKNYADCIYKMDAGKLLG